MNRTQGKTMARAGSGVSARSRAAAVLAAACVVLSSLAAGADAITPDSGAWVTDGAVHSIARADGRTYIGGDFQNVGPRTGHAVQLTRAGPGALAPGPGAFPEVSGGSVRTVLADGAGGWFLGGDFTHVGGLLRYRLAHIVPDGAGGLTVDGWSPNADGTVRALARGRSPLDSHILYVGGSFQNLNGSSRPYAGAVDAGTGVLHTNWNPAPNADVHAIAAAPVQLKPQGVSTTMSVVVLGGAFTKLGEATVARLGAAWGVGASKPDGSSSEGTIPGWNGNRESTVRALALSPTVGTADAPQQFFAVYSGGDFGAGATKITLNSATGSLIGGIYGEWSPAPACDAGCTPIVRTLVASGSTVYLGGDFTRLGGAAGPVRSRIGAVAAIAAPEGAGNAATIANWDPNAEGGRVNALAVAGADVYAGGDFFRMRGTERRGLAALDANTANASPTLREWNPRATGGLTGVVQALAATESAVFAGGSFTSIGATPLENLAVFDSSGSPDSSWAPNPDDTVRALSAANGRIYVGGDFANVAGQPRSRLAALSLANGSLDPNWQPVVGPAATAQVLTLSATDETVYVGGGFTSLAGESRQNAGAVHPATGAPTQWDPHPNGNVYSVLATCGTVFAGGGFTQAGGAERTRLAALDPVTGTPTPWNPGANSTVYGLAQAEGVLYVGGRFSLIGGALRQNLAAVSLTTAKATAWNPTVAGDSVRAVALSPAEPLVYAGGDFDKVGSQFRRNLAAIDRASGEPTGWDAGTDDGNSATGDTVRALVTAGAALYAGGDFRQMGDPPAMQVGFGSIGNALATATDPVTCGPPAPSEEPATTPPPPTPDVVRQVEAPPLVDALAPLLTKLSAKPKRFRVVTPGKGGGRASFRRPTPERTVFRYSLSEAGTAVFTFQIAKRCPKARTEPRRRRCIRWVTVGAREYASVTGPNQRRFKGRVTALVKGKTRRRYLRPGRYRALVRAFDAAGNRSERLRVRFKVLRG